MLLLLSEWERDRGFFFGAGVCAGAETGVHACAGVSASADVDAGASACTD